MGYGDFGAGPASSNPGYLHVTRFTSDREVLAEIRAFLDAEMEEFIRSASESPFSNRVDLEQSYSSPDEYFIGARLR